MIGFGARSSVFFDNRAPNMLSSKSPLIESTGSTSYACFVCGWGFCRKSLRAMRCTCSQINTHRLKSHLKSQGVFKVMELIMISERIVWDLNIIPKFSTIGVECKVCI